MTADNLPEVPQAPVPGARVEARYTLDEAQRELVRRECLRYGHDYDVRIDQRRGEWPRPVKLVCDRRCGEGPWWIAGEGPS